MDPAQREGPHMAAYVHLLSLIHILVFTAGAEELAAAVAQVQAEPDAPQEEDGLLTEAVNRTILGGLSLIHI